MAYAASTAVAERLVLHGSPYSTCTRRVNAVFYYYGTAPQFVLVDFSKGEHKGAEFRKLQPFGQVPALRDGNFTVFESRAIGRYVDGLLGGRLTGGDDPKQKALIEQWISVDHDNWNPYVAKIVAQKLGWRGPTDEKLVAELFNSVKPAFDVYDAHLANSKYLAGDNITLADISHLPYTELFYKLGGEFQEAFDSRPNLLRWYKDATSQEFWQKATAFKG